MKICPHCKHKNTTDARRCVSCGQALDASPAAPKPLSVLDSLGGGESPAARLDDIFSSSYSSLDEDSLETVLESSEVAVAALLAQHEAKAKAPPTPTSSPSPPKQSEAGSSIKPTFGGLVPMSPPGVTPARAAEGAASLYQAGVAVNEREDLEEQEELSWDDMLDDEQMTALPTPVSYAKVGEAGTPSISSAFRDDPLIGAVIGGYKLLKKIGAGGFGAVYEAQKDTFGQSVAIKLLNVTHHETVTVERFFREARALSQLKHPNIVEFFDFGQVEGEAFYLVMEMLNGPSLRDYCRRGHVMEAKRVKSLIGQLCSALDYIHAQKVYHRDLKPGNIILVTDQAGREQLKLIDFGVAAVAEEENALTKTGACLGSPSYMSPEQARGDTRLVDGRSDMYSVGIMLVQMLTGKLPYTAPNFAAMLGKHLFAPVPSLSELAPEGDWCPALEILIQRTLAKQPDDRPSTIGRFWEECEAALDRQIAGSFYEDDDDEYDATEVATVSIAEIAKAYEDSVETPLNLDALSPPGDSQKRAPYQGGASHSESLDVHLRNAIFDGHTPQPSVSPHAGAGAVPAMAVPPAPPTLPSMGVLPPVAPPTAPAPVDPFHREPAWDSVEIGAAKQSKGKSSLLLVGVGGVLALLVWGLVALFSTTPDTTVRQLDVPDAGGKKMHAMQRRPAVPPRPVRQIPDARTSAPTVAQYTFQVDSSPTKAEVWLVEKGKATKKLGTTPFLMFRKPKASVQLQLRHPGGYQPHDLQYTFTTERGRRVIPLRRLRPRPRPRKRSGNIYGIQSPI
jgi:serine/threonine protein kinase